MNRRLLVIGLAVVLALLLGVGGGSLAKFLLKHVPEARIDAVDKRARVLEVASGYCNLEYDLAEGRRGHRHAHAEPDARFSR